MVSRSPELTGTRFGKLVVVTGIRRVNGTPAWRCRCDCGTESVVITGDLRSGNSRSCGCGQRKAAAKVCRQRSTTHGWTGARLYNIWHGMILRCYYKTQISYARYGGRGITVCDEWRHDFRTFRDWALANGYAANLTIDRRDNDGNYHPDNCRWITIQKQQCNRSTSRIIEWNGKRQAISEWARETGIRSTSIRYRLFVGWPLERVFTEPMARP